MDNSSRFDLSAAYLEESDEEPFVNLDDVCLPIYVDGSESDEEQVEIQGIDIKEKEFVGVADQNEEQLVNEEDNDVVVDNSNVVPAPYVGMSFKSSKEFLDHCHD